MRIIFSRKGTDSAAGGIPSPIINGLLYPLPIPTKDNSGISYDDLSAGDVSYGKLVKDLSRGKQKLAGSQNVHLDPDLRRDLRRRKKGWCPLLGLDRQDTGTTHWQNCGVTVGDLFLFFGWFREAENSDGNYRYLPDERGRHVFFGWLQVGAIIPCARPGLVTAKWASHHPHIQGGYGTAFIARPDLRLDNRLASLPGAGHFPRYHECLELTAEGQTRGKWRLPEWFRPRGGQFPLTYHDDMSCYIRRKGHTIVRSRARPGFRS